MKLSREQMVAAAGILHYAVTSESVKLRWGTLQRQIMKDKIARGEPVNGYRADWLRKSRNAVVETLSKCAEEFNGQYPHDRISAVDLVDVLNSTLRSFQTVKKIRENSQDAS